MNQQLSSPAWPVRVRLVLAGIVLAGGLVPGYLAAADSPAESASVDAAQVVTEASESKRNRALVASLTIFVLAVFVGFEIITKVPPTLHTPLMSGSNAISGIALVGAVIVAGQTGGMPWLGMLAVVFATINVVGGFLVTHRMLAMFVRPRTTTEKGE